MHDLTGFGIDDKALATAAAGALLGYVEETQKQRLPHLTAIAVESASDAIAMNATRRHLELDTRVDGDTRHTLLGVLDTTVTPMGGRLLRRWLHRPLRDRRLLGERHHAVATLMEHAARDLRTGFRGLGDLERILTRVALRSARPRDLSTLRDGLALLPEVQGHLAPLDSPRLRALAAELGEHADTAALLIAAIAAQPPLKLSDGGVLADGYDAELDELRRLSTNADQFLVDLEARERASSGIATLKVGYNRVHGYYIEISKGQADKAPVHYTRRQTLTGAERYITEELKQFEDKVLSARERSSREKLLYDALLDTLNARLEPLKRCAAALSELDVLAAFSERAQELDWAQPELDEALGLRIERGRHPVVEAVRKEPFEPNDLVLDEGRRMLVITGPNMGGKSTYMRQNALIVLLAHIGSFVPASRAVIGPIDRILTRIGAGDDLASVASPPSWWRWRRPATSCITPLSQSLVLMDEIGCGTSTYDGSALADAVARHLAGTNRCYTLFATHYFELTALAGEPGSGIANDLERARRYAGLHACGEGGGGGPELRPAGGRAGRLAQDHAAAGTPSAGRAGTAWPGNPCIGHGAAGARCTAAVRPVRRGAFGRTGSPGGDRSRRTVAQTGARSAVSSQGAALIL